MFGSAGDGGAKKIEKARQASVTQGQQEIDQQFSGFDPAFYDQAATDYQAAATPGMLADFQQTRNNLTYALSRGANQNSSVAIQRNNSLGRQLADNESQITNNAQGYANDLRGRVSTQKGQLTNQLLAGANPEQIQSQATAATSQIRAPSPIQPLGNLFADWSSMYLQNQKGNAGGGENAWSGLLNKDFGTVN